MRSNAGSNERPKRATTFQLIRNVFIIGSIAAVAGAVGGLVAYFWSVNFQVELEDKLDIFLGVLAVTAVVFAAAGFSTYSLLHHSLEARGTQLGDALSESLLLSGHQAHIRQVWQLAEAEWALGNVWLRSEPPNLQYANGIFSHALALAEMAQAMAENYLRGPDHWQKELTIDIKNILVWLYAHLGVQDVSLKAYALAGDLQEWAKGREDDLWRYVETCNYLRFKLPRWPTEQTEALKQLDTLLDRRDIPDDIKNLLRIYYYGLPPSA